MNFEVKVLDKNNTNIAQDNILSTKNISTLRVTVHADETITDLIDLEFSYNFRITLTKNKRMINEYNYYPLLSKLPTEIGMSIIPVYPDIDGILFEIDRCEFIKPVFRKIHFSYLLNCNIKN